eukprot:10175978-Heterocapsa_arctica.AAC.1
MYLKTGLTASTLTCQRASKLSRSTRAWPPIVCTFRSAEPRLEDEPTGVTSMIVWAGDRSAATFWATASMAGS